MTSVRNHLAAGAALLTAGSAWACPPSYHQASAEPSLWQQWVPLFFFVGVPAMVFRVLAPSPLSLGENRKLLGLRVWGALLGAFLAATLAFKERRIFLTKVTETLRQKIQFEGLQGVWRTWAAGEQGMFHRLFALSNVVAAIFTLGMWTWTVTDPSVTWGDGAEVPVTFLADSFLTFYVARFFTRRVGMHLGVITVMPGSSFARGIWMAIRAMVLGFNAGFLGGALFGVSSGIQTMAMVPGVRADVMGWLPFWYGANMAVWGSLAALLTGLALVAFPAPRKLLPAHV